jgi:hypothetical protein
MNYQTRTMAPDFLPPIHRPNMPLVVRPAINGSQKGMWPASPRERDGCLVRFTRACVGCGGERSTWYETEGVTLFAEERYYCKNGIQVING